jgi:hypothetical protein
VGNYRSLIAPDNRRDRERRIEIARRVWNGAKDARGSPVVRYLAGRGITINPPPSLRWAPALRRPDGTQAPAMVGEGIETCLAVMHATKVPTWAALSLPWPRL